MFSKKLISLLMVGTISIGMQAKAETPALDPKAMEILKIVGDGIRSKEALNVNIKIEMKVTAAGMKQEMTSDSAVSLKHPNFYANRMTATMNATTIICDGKKLYIHMDMLKKYTEEDAPKTLGELGTNPMIGGAGLSALHNFLLAEDPYVELTKGLTECSYVGIRKLGETECHVVEAEQEAMDWTAWITVGDDAVLMKMVPDLSKAMAKAAEMTDNLMLKEMEQELTLSFNDWNFTPTFDDATFQFEVPEGAEKVDSFFGGKVAGNEDHELIGQAAPDFTLPVADGEDVKLSSYNGKKVVILDFWATWCGPCVSALPKIAKVAEEYKDKDVVFVAVNQRESGETIKAFLEKKGLKFTCAMDTEGSVGELYKVKGIPQTVVIGKDGKVASVHVGFIPGMEKQLAEELDALLK